MERGEGNLSAIQEIEQRHGIPVIAIASLDDLMGWLQDSAEFRQNLGSIREYRKLYGITQHA
jgi:orotate phosphoribosyltransferase